MKKKSKILLGSLVFLIAFALLVMHMQKKQGFYLNEITGVIFSPVAYWEKHDSMIYSDEDNTIYLPASFHFLHELYSSGKQLYLYAYELLPQEKRIPGSLLSEVYAPHAIAYPEAFTDVQSIDASQSKELYLLADTSYVNKSGKDLFPSTYEKSLIRFSTEDSSYTVLHKFPFTPPRDIDRSESTTSYYPDKLKVMNHHFLLLISKNSPQENSPKENTSTRTYELWIMDKEDLNQKQIIPLEARLLDIDVSFDELVMLDSNKTLWHYKETEQGLEFQHRLSLKSQLNKSAGKSIRLYFSQRDQTVFLYQRETLEKQARYHFGPYYLIRQFTEVEEISPDPGFPKQTMGWLKKEGKDQTVMSCIKFSGSRSKDSLHWLEYVDVPLFKE
jgi:hypothetical protein